jgi:hypothetical protein
MFRKTCPSRYPSRTNAVFFSRHCNRRRRSNRQFRNFVVGVFLHPYFPSFLRHLGVGVSGAAVSYNCSVCTALQCVFELFRLQDQGVEVFALALRFRLAGFRVSVERVPQMGAEDSNGRKAT